MTRTAEEFVQQLPTGRWVVADYPVGGRLPCLLVEGVVVLPEAVVDGDKRITKYSQKRSAKRAAQRLLDVVDGVRPGPAANRGVSVSGQERRDAAERYGDRR